jgi:hypothetical protein
MMRGDSPRTLMEIRGHTNIKMTLRCAHRWRLPEAKRRGQNAIAVLL